jgi:hypothetical protein
MIPGQSAPPTPCESSSSFGGGPLSGSESKDFIGNQWKVEGIPVKIMEVSHFAVTGLAAGHFPGSWSQSLCSHQKSKNKNKPQHNKKTKIQ